MSTDEEENGKPTLFYRLFGWWIRWQACKLAATAFVNMEAEDSAQMMWSLAVFFETYIIGGSAATLEDFGPKEPVSLEVVRDAAS